MPRREDDNDFLPMPISVIMFDTSPTGNTAYKKQQGQEQHHQDDRASTTRRHLIEAIVFTPTTPFEHYKQNHNNHKRQRSTDNNDYAPFDHCRQRLVSYENEEELRAKMNALYEDTVSMDQDEQQQMRPPLDQGKSFHVVVDEDGDEDDSLWLMNNMESNAVLERTIRKVRFQESFHHNSKRRAIESIPFPMITTRTRTTATPATTLLDDKQVPTARETTVTAQTPTPIPTTPNHNTKTTTTNNYRSLPSLLFRKNNYKTTKQTSLNDNTDTNSSSKTGQVGDDTSTVGTATTITMNNNNNNNNNSNSNNDYYADELSVSCHDNYDDDAPASPSTLTAITKKKKQRKSFWKKWLFPMVVSYL
jgi:hypothetical protein